ncbi:galactosyltransferase-related protein [Ekhidna sp.]
MLNLALARASGKYATAYDIDLVPYEFSFETHLRLAEESKSLLMSGYRINSNIEELENIEIVWEYMKRGNIAEEDLEEGCLKSQFFDRERFGVLPFFLRKELDRIGGWDERFMGWGAEDQDIIGRYLGDSRFLLKSPDLLYLHLNHGTSEGWNEKVLTKKNVHLYETKRMK